MPRVLHEKKEGKELNIMDEQSLQLARAMVDLDVNEKKPKSIISRMQDKQQAFSRSELSVEQAEPRR
ncbi:hypothetical protein PV327_009266 [Microctonus hyperodae]|uniref:Uncharacterized protein n=1 Tax=Microctonus hyperodae TaxID=165561 RepID=A0AA39FTW6_MICHY|nr:hypothetical protein PV327_009266 [Microctonus hyperodae]